MGAWGAGSFENDDALDWVGEFCDQPGETAIYDALRAVTEIGEGEYLEAPECSMAIAAAEIVAALKGAPGPDMPQELKDCVGRLNPSAASQLIQTALKALARVKADSELKELWDESQDANEWYDAVGELESRLRT